MIDFGILHLNRILLYGQRFDIESREASVANKYKTTGGLCPLQRACDNSMSIRCMDNMSMHWVAFCVHEAKCIHRHHGTAGREKHTYFYLMGEEVDLEEYSEFLIVASGRGHRLSSVLHYQWGLHIDLSQAPRSFS